LTELKKSEDGDAVLFKGVVPGHIYPEFTHSLENVRSQIEFGTMEYNLLKYNTNYNKHSLVCMNFIGP